MEYARWPWSQKILTPYKKNTPDFIPGYLDLACHLLRCLFFNQRPARSQFADDAASKRQHADNKDQPCHHRHRLT
jgi:hypothetical protein